MASRSRGAARNRRGDRDADTPEQLGDDAENTMGALRTSEDQDGLRTSEDQDGLVDTLEGDFHDASGIIIDEENEDGKNGEEGATNPLNVGQIQRDANTFGQQGSLGEGQDALRQGNVFVPQSLTPGYDRRRLQRAYSNVNLPVPQPARIPRTSLQELEEKHRKDLLLLKVMSAIKPKFSGSNFQVWRECTIKGWARKLGLIDIISGKLKEPGTYGLPATTREKDDWIDMDADAVLFFQHALSEAMIKRYCLAGRKSAEIYQAIIADHIQENATSQGRHEFELENFKQTDDIPLDTFLNEIETQVSFIRTELKVPYNDQKLIYVVRSNIHEKFSTVLESIIDSWETRENELIMEMIHRDSDLTVTQARKKVAAQLNHTFLKLKSELLEKVRSQWHVRHQKTLLSNRINDSVDFPGFKVIRNQKKPGPPRNKKKQNKCPICNGNHYLSHCPHKKNRGCFRCGEEHKLRECTKSFKDTTRKNPYCTMQGCSRPSGDHHTKDCPQKKSNRRNNDDDMGTFGMMEQDTSYFGYEVGENYYDPTNYCSTTIILDGEGNPSEVDITSEDDIALELAKTISLVEVVTDTALLYKLKQQRNTLNGILVKLRQDDSNDKHSTTSTTDDSICCSSRDDRFSDIDDFSDNAST
jgi:hypothetical protein